MHSDPIRYLTIEVGARGIAELQDRGRPVFVPRQEIRRIALERGIPAERPIAQILVGVACLLAGAVCFFFLLGWILMGGVTSRYLPAGGGVALVFGFWVIWTAIRPAYFLRVEAKGDVRKLVFHGTVEHREIERLLRRANRTWDYGIVSTLPEVRL
jgi:hypothetical protein